MFKKVWTWLDGKKTVIAAVFWSVVPLLNAPAGSKEAFYLNIAGWALTALGLGHKAVKAAVDSPTIQ